MKVAWLTDIHLNFLEGHERVLFYKEIIKVQSTCIFLTGDIAEADSIKAIMKEMSECIARPIYFVLGNHDYYRGNIIDVKKCILELCENDPNLFYLPANDYIELEEGICLLGEDGWADARHGNYDSSYVSLADSRLIADLFQKKIMSRDHLQRKMQQLADADAAKLKLSLINACENKYHKIVILMHVPPFPECCLYEGKLSNDDFMSFFSSKAMGDVLLEVVKNYAEIDFLVLAGHTHHKAEYQALDNLLVRVGAAEYYEPWVECFILSDM